MYYLPDDAGTKLINFLDTSTIDIVGPDPKKPTFHILLTSGVEVDITPNNPVYDEWLKQVANGCALVGYYPSFTQPSNTYNT